jgi:hypothetical protein
MASEMMLTDPEMTPTTSFNTINKQFDAMESSATRDLRFIAGRQKVKTGPDYPRYSPENFSKQEKFQSIQLVIENRMR